jgi:ATP-dependent exoDNAse (exonuclease V) beta subunit
VLPLYWTSKGADTPQIYFDALAPRYSRNVAGEIQTAGTHASLINSDDWELARQADERLVLDPEQVFAPELVAQAVATREQWLFARDDAANSLRRAQRFGVASKLEADTHAGLPPEVNRGARFGSFVHEIMEQLDLPRGERLHELATHFRRGYNLSDDDAAAAIRMIQELLHTELFAQRVAAAEKTYRELPYAAEVEGVLYSGRMDLVFIEAGAPVIIDYKTNSATDEAALREKYGMQAKIYAAALQAILRSAEPEVIFCMMRTGRQLRMAGK